jgi:glycosyltransferase involved in cell wall biosynthesis
MKILHVITCLGVGGAETMLAKVLGALGPRVDARVVSLTDDGPIGERIRALGVETKALGMRRGIPDLRGVLKLAREIRAFRPDIVQTWMYHADLVGGLAALLTGRPPVIWGVRGADLDPTTAKWTTLGTLQLCAWLSRAIPARIVSNSVRGRDFHVARGYSDRKTVVVPNGFDLEAFTPREGLREEVRSELGIPRDAPLVGMVARYHAQKDFQNFSMAAGALAVAEPRARFLLCGEGVTSQNHELTRWLREAGVLERTFLLGRRSDVPRILASLDLFTLSSATEGFPNALGEAMACAVPCVATDAGDSGYVMGDAGRLVPTRDPAALAAAWRDVLRLPEREREELRERGRRRVSENFTIAAVARQFEALYEDVRSRR